MTTTDTVKEKSIPQKRAAILLPLFITAIITTLVGLVIFGWSRFTRTTVPQMNAAVPLPVAAAANQDMYILARGWDGENAVLVLDPASGKVNRRFTAGYNAIVKLTADRGTLYIYNQGYSEDVIENGAVLAVDTSTGTQLWQVDVPGAPFGPPTRVAWLSTDEQHLYLLGSPDNLRPHIFVVNTQSQTLVNDFELPLPYPSNVDQAFPKAWKLPESETLVVVSRDKLFTFDLTSGQASNAFQLFDPDDIKRVPVNLPYNTFVWDGDIVPERQQLFLATSTQEILAVNLGSQPFTVQSVLSLPDGWQFAVIQPLLYHPDEEAIYIQVKRTDTPVNNGLEAEDVWVYDTNSWTQTVRLSLREQLINASIERADDSTNRRLDLTNYGLALSPNGQEIYSLSKGGVLQINGNSNGFLDGSWLNVYGEDLASYAEIFIVP